MLAARGQGRQSTSARPTRESPPDQLFFAGGAGSVRGYAYRSIGVEATNDDGETGVGRRAQPASRARARCAYRINERFGAVGFFDAGYVSPRRARFARRRTATSASGAGVGVRYFTGLGPLRVDLATPINPRARRFAGRGLHRHRTGVLKRILALLGAAGRCSAWPRSRRTSGDATTTGQDDNGFVINFLQNTISAPGRQIRLQGVTGALSSQARIGEAHHLRRRRRLAAARGHRDRLEPPRAAARARQRQPAAVERIDFLRRPVPHGPSLGGPAAARSRRKPFALPDLPVSVQIARARAAAHRHRRGSASGQASSSARPDASTSRGGALDASLDVQPARRRGRRARRSRSTSPTRPASSTSTSTCRSRRAASSRRCSTSRTGRRSTCRSQGAGPLDALDVDFAFDAGGARIADGEVQLRGADAGLGFTADFRGELSPVVPAALPRLLRAARPSSRSPASNVAEGGFRIDRLAVQRRGARPDRRAQTAPPTAFRRNLTLSGRLGDPRGPAVTLPVPGGATTIHSAALYVDYGAGRRWNGLVALDRLGRGRHRDRGPDARHSAASPRTSTTRRGATSPSRSRASRPASVRPRIPTSPRRWARGSTCSPTWRCRPDGPARDPPGAGQRQRRCRSSSPARSTGSTSTAALAAQLADIAPASGLAGRDLAARWVDLAMSGIGRPARRRRST